MHSRAHSTRIQPSVGVLVGVLVGTVGGLDLCIGLLGVFGSLIAQTLAIGVFKGFREIVFGSHKKYCQDAVAKKNKKAGKQKTDIRPRM